MFKLQKERSFSDGLQVPKKKKKKIERLEDADPPRENAEIYAINTPTKT